MPLFLDYFSDMVGCVGTIIVLLTYALLQMGKMKVQSFLYSFLNFVAALMIMFSLINHWNLAAFIMEFTWALVSMYGLCKLVLSQRQTVSSKS